MDLFSSLTDAAVAETFVSWFLRGTLLSVVLVALAPLLSRGAAADPAAPDPAEPAA